MKTRILLTVFAFTGVASAASYYNDSSITLAQGSYVDYNVAKFNSNLGTLTAVTVSVNLSHLQGTTTVTNETTSNVTIIGFHSHPTEQA